MDLTPDLAPVLVLASGAAHAIVNALLKAGRDKMAGRALIDGFSALLVAPIALLVPTPGDAWPYLAASGLVHILYLLGLIKSFEGADMSQAYPIARGVAPVLTATAAVLIVGEPIGVATMLGIGLVSLGVVAIGAGRALSGRALGWSLTTGLSIAVYTVIDAQGVRAAPSAASYIAWSFLILGIGVGGLFAVWRGRAFIGAAASQWRPGLIAGGLSVLSYGLALTAFRLGATPRLAALRETSILFATLIAVVFLKERLTRGRLAGILAIAAGAMVLVARG